MCWFGCLFSVLLSIHCKIFTHLHSQVRETWTEQDETILVPVVRAQEAAVLFPMHFSV